MFPSLSAPKNIHLITVPNTVCVFVLHVFKRSSGSVFLQPVPCSKETLSYRILIWSFRFFLFVCFFFMFKTSLILNETFRTSNIDKTKICNPCTLLLSSLLSYHMGWMCVIGSVMAKCVKLITYPNFNHVELLFCFQSKRSQITHQSDETLDVIGRSNQSGRLAVERDIHIWAWVGQVEVINVLWKKMIHFSLKTWTLLLF